MLVTKVFPKTAPYIMAAAMAVGLGTSTLKAAQNDIFEKVEPKFEMVKAGQEDAKRGVPWLSIIGAGFLLAFFGVIKFGEYIEKKLGEEESKKAGKNENPNENVLSNEPMVKD